MIELTVALLSGLIVAMGIVGLSREATNTFNDEARSSAAEAGLRTAMERLRADLERAGYMSTGNILLDPWLALVPGSLAGSGNTASYVPTPTAPTGAIGMAGLRGLASIFWLDNGSNGQTGGVNNKLTLSASQTPVLTPDLIQIAGNLTAAEQFDVQSIDPSTPACGSGGIRVYLSPNSPAMVRTLGGPFTLLVNSGNSASFGLILQNIFSPDAASSFLVRLVDKTGHAQYLATCPSPSAGINAGLQPFVRLDGANTPVLYATASGSVSRVGGVSGFCTGCTINPVQIVQWEITTKGGADNEPTPDNNLGFLSATQTQDPLKYDLMRSYLDATGTLVGSTSEIVAEYAVDLAFAFTGDNGTSLAPAAVSSTTSCALDDGTTCNTNWANQISALTTPQGPQRIRSVRARIATRTAQADRLATTTGGIPLAPGQYSTGTFMYRYNLGLAVPLTWARVRTLTAEVSLPNQARNFY
jgi:hypothetical protein